MTLEFLRRACPDLLDQLLAVAVGQNLHLPARLPHGQRPSQIQPGRWFWKAGPDFLEAISGVVRLHGKQFPASFNNREFVDQTLELRDEMRRDKDGPVLGIACMVGPDDRLDKLP